MAHIVRNTDAQNHRITITTDKYDGQVILVRGKKLAYLWIGPDGEKPVHVSGAIVLRKLAHAILKEINQ